MITLGQILFDFNNLVSEVQTGLAGSYLVLCLVESCWVLLGLAGSCWVSLGIAGPCWALVGLEGLAKF